jgi:hypothetical protein
MSGSNSSDPACAARPAEANEANEASPLRFTVHSLPEPGAPERRTTSGRLKMLLVLLVCALPVIASYLAYYVIKPQGRSNYSELIEPQRPLPADLGLTDLQGQAVAAATLHGQWLLVVVAGGACDAECERMLWLQRQLREALGREKHRVDKLWLILDTVTPAARTLQAVSGADPALVLHAAPAALAAWLRSAEVQAPGAHVYIVDPMGHWMMRSPANPDPSKLKRDLEKLLRASAGWDKPGRAAPGNAPGGG